MRCNHSIIVWLDFRFLLVTTIRKKNDCGQEMGNKSCENLSKDEIIIKSLFKIKLQYHLTRDMGLRDAGLLPLERGLGGLKSASHSLASRVQYVN